MAIDYKAQFHKDVAQTFLDPSIFADWHVINGARVVAQMDKILTKEQSEDDLLGVFVNQLRIYVRSEDLQKIPVEGELLDVDGGWHLVRSVSDEDGVLVIVVEANEQ